LLAAVNQIVSSFWRPPTPRSTTLATLCRFIAATYASIAVLFGKCEWASISGPL
jgi:hypothetical protein